MEKGDVTHCDCGHDAVSDGFTTGYGVDRDGKKTCFACCGEEDKRTLRETGVLRGYLTYDQEPKVWSRKGYEAVKNGAFTNWPGTLRLPIIERVKRSLNNWGAPRIDFWIVWEGRRYHGVQVGESSQCATIRLVKGRK